MYAEIRVTLSADEGSGGERPAALRRRSTTRSHLSLPLSVASSGCSTPSAPATPLSPLVHPTLALLKVLDGDGPPGLKRLS